jgi:carotenoid cleavage dioxygenase-like enzyme
VCYVQHPCPKGPSPYSDQVCFSILRTTDDSLNVQPVARAQMKKSKIIQHSHSPCLTERYVVSKVDAFVGRNPINKNGGLLKFLRQGEDSLWFVLDRLTNETKLIRGTNKFVNNHFWNCYEDDQGMIVVETVASTEDYLDTYFSRNLANDHPDWNAIFHPALRCHLSFSSSSIRCAPLFNSSSSSASSVASSPLIFDYPTFNPHYKKKAYQYFYGISIKSNTSAWFDKLIKVDVRSNEIVKEWSSPNVYLTEFDFVPTANDRKEAFQLEEDDGILLSILYNATNDSSMFGVFNASTIEPIGIYPMEHTVPFHAHGIVCKPGNPCFTNP